MKTKIKLYYISLVYYFLLGIIILLIKEKLISLNIYEEFKIIYRLLIFTFCSIPFLYTPIIANHIKRNKKETTN